MATIALDLRPTQNSHRRRGIGRYVNGLFGAPGAADAFQSLNPLWLRQRLAWEPPRVTSDATGLTVTLPPRPQIRLDPLGASLLRRSLERRSPALTHLTDPYLYAQAPARTRLVVTVYDLIMLGRSDRLGMRFSRGMTAACARADARFVTISRTVAEELSRRLKVEPERIVVVRPGPTDWPPHVPQVEDIAVVLGAVDRHKRVDHAIAAARLADVQIRLIGRHEPALLQQLDTTCVLITSDAPDAVVAARVAGCRCVVHASAVEGFGLPVLEALTLGTPVVAYELPITREIVGPEYPLVPAHEGPSGLAAQIAACADPAFRRSLVDLAAPHVGSFSWTRSRQRLMEAYEGWITV